MRAADDFAAIRARGWRSWNRPETRSRPENVTTRPGWNAASSYWGELKSRRGSLGESESSGAAAC